MSPDRVAHGPDRPEGAQHIVERGADRRLDKGGAEFSRWREHGVGTIMLVNLAAASRAGWPLQSDKKLWVALTGT